jgi:hypothetical protein
VAAAGHVGSDQHLREPAIGPLQVARANVEPLLERLDVDLAWVGAGLGELLRGQATEAVDRIAEVGNHRQARVATGQ